MKHFLFVVLLIAGLALPLTACQAAPTAMPTDTATPEAPTESAEVPTVSPKWTPTPLPSPTPEIPPTPVDTPTPEATPTPVPADVWVDAVNGLNLRAEAKADAQLVTTLKHQQHLVALDLAGAPDAGGISWQNVRTDDGKTGWVSAQYLTKTNPANPTPAATTAAAAATVVATTSPVTTTTSIGNVWVNTAGGLNLRAEPNTNAAVVATLNYGQRLAALAPKTAPDAGGVAWQNVRTEANQTGWAAADYLTSTPPVTATVSPTSIVPSVAGTDAANVLLQRLNELRAQNGMATFELSPQLTAAAQRHSLDMAKTGKISVNGSDGSIPTGRMQAAGYPGKPGEEIVSGGPLTIEEVWYDWVSNRPNANVLLNPEYIRVGIAVANAGANSYYTADFGAP